MNIVLASGSPRRKEILSQIGLEFQVDVSDAKEDSKAEDPGELVKELSFRKAEAVLKKRNDNKDGEDIMIIGADTVVSCDGLILGKPFNEEDAVKMLRKLSGREHEVYTGVTVIVCRKEKDEPEIISFSECTRVRFFEMSEKEIQEYTATKDPLDKAGSYGIQGFCARYILGIDGDYNNVVGLPAGRLYQAIKKYL